MSSVPQSIVIVGAGFSGTAVAINLLRLRHEVPVKVLLVDAAPVARGLAYASRHYPYLLNVPAGRMSACAADPGEFLRFAQARTAQASAADFLPRELYGEYLEGSLAGAEREAAADVHFERLRGLVIAVERAHRGRGFIVHCIDGRRLRADTLVLALGNPPPAALPGTEALSGSSRYVEDPWQTPPAFRPRETVLAIGTGLTMADVVHAGNQAAGGTAIVHALSRHGLVPAPQSDFEQTHVGHDSRPLLRAAAISARQRVRAVRALSQEIERRGGDWREAITFVRTLAPSLWQRLSVGERRRFLRHARCYWDIHRHRLPQHSWSALEELRDCGRLHVHAGRLLALEPAGKQIRVTWRARGKRATQTLLVDRVINCTGPDYDVRRSRQRLVRSLVAHGLALPDSLGLGFVTDGRGALTDVSGRSAADLYYIGPLLRGTHWETTAVPELRDYAARLAQHLLDTRPETAVTGTGRPPARSVDLHP